MEEVKLYSQMQMGLATLLGGPLAATYMFKKNFVAMENEDASKKSAVFGILFSFALIVVLPFLPKNFPHIVLPIAYIVTTERLAKQYQLSKQAIVDSEKYTFQSNWNVLGVSVAALALLTVTFILYFMGLNALNVIDMNS